MMNKKPVLIVGSIALDTIETSAGRRENLLGGSTTYALVAAGRSADVHVVGIVGDDFPAAGMEIYQRYASCLDGLVTASGPTFRWGGRYHALGDNRTTLFTELGVFAQFNPVLSSIDRNVPLVFLANIHPQLQLSVIRQTDSAALIVTDTMNLWIDTTPDQLAQVIKKTDILLINETEAQALGNDMSLDQAAEKLKAMGPETVVIKQGSKGASLYTATEKIDIGIFPLEQVIDPTGAGDTFGGGFLAALANGENSTNALINGSALASFCVEGFGIEQLANCNTIELERRKEYLADTVST